MAEPNVNTYIDLLGKTVYEKEMAPETASQMKSTLATNKVVTFTDLSLFIKNQEKKWWSIKMPLGLRTRLEKQCKGLKAVAKTSKKSSTKVPDRVQRLFKELDKDGDGFITAAELCNLPMPSTNQKINTGTVRNLCFLYDADTSGVLDLQELWKLDYFIWSACKSFACGDVFHSLGEPGENVQLPDPFTQTFGLQNFDEASDLSARVEDKKLDVHEFHFALMNFEMKLDPDISHSLFYSWSPDGKHLNFQQYLNICVTIHLALGWGQYYAQEDGSLKMTPAQLVGLMCSASRSW